MASNRTDEIEVTPAMIEAGAAVLWELAGEASKEAQARAVFEAMLEARPPQEDGQGPIA